jgi:hypothetical protein
VNHEHLKQMQASAYGQVKAAGADAIDPTHRAELLADEREARLLTMINEAVYFGTIKAHLTLAVIGALLWFIAVRVI